MTKNRRKNRKRLARINEDADLYGLQPQNRRTWRRVLEILGHVCLACGELPVTRDHIVPLARGGLNHPTNLQPLCERCNGHKGDRIMDYRTAEQRERVLARWPLERRPVEKYQQEPMRTALLELATG